jgi:hypothetical protein
MGTARNLANFKPSSAGLAGVEDLDSSATQLFGMRNRLINGDMRIAQRATTATYSSNTSRGFVLDRWYGEGYPLNATISKSTLSFDGTTWDCASISSITGAYSFYQPVEDMVKYDKNKTFTVSFVASGSGNLQPSYNASTVGTVNIGSAVALTATPTRYTATFTISNSATGDHLYLGFSGSGGSLNITLVQLEAGSVATPFERRPIATELALCQRYYVDLANNGGSTQNAYRAIGFAVTYTTTQGTYVTQVPVPMRALPSLTQAGTMYLQNLGTTSVSGFGGPYSIAGTVIEGDFSMVGAVTANITAILRWNNSSTQRFAYSAEL